MNTILKGLLHKSMYLQKTCLLGKTFYQEEFLVGDNFSQKKISSGKSDKI